MAISPEDADGSDHRASGHCNRIKFPPSLGAGRGVGAHPHLKEIEILASRTSGDTKVGGRAWELHFELFFSRSAIEARKGPAATMVVLVKGERRSS